MVNRPEEKGIPPHGADNLQLVLGSRRVVKFVWRPEVVLPAFFIAQENSREAGNGMALAKRDDVRNLAIIAHVDHGKTTLADAMLWQSAVYLRTDGSSMAVMDELDPDRRKEIRVMAKNTSMSYRGVRINLIDAPGRADFGGDVERTLKMVDGILLLVDACEGPVPQTRFVLRRALEEGLAPIVVINKIDLPQARPGEVLEEIRELFIDLDAAEAQLDFPVLYCDALRGVCRTDLRGEETPLAPLFEKILSTVPPPEYETDGPVQFLVTGLDYDDYLGRLAIGRLVTGTIEKGQELAHCRPDGTTVPCTIGGLYGYDGLRRIEIDRAEPGDIVALTGVEAVRIGATLSDPSDPRPLAPIKVGEPTIAIEIGVNDSPLGGIDGTHVSAASLRERLWGEILANPSVLVEETDSPDAFRVSGRGELQLAILVEMMRREGYEMSVGRPVVLSRIIDGVSHEPIERLVIDCPQEFVGVVREKVDARLGRMTRMVDHGTGRVRMEFVIPSRALIGFRTEFLNDTRGTGIMTQIFDGYEPQEETGRRRARGALVADRGGRATADAIGHLQARGTMFVAPGDQVYEGMIVGENSRSSDLDVNITKEARASEPTGSMAESTVPLIPPRALSLEQSLEFIGDDELVEATPRSLRLRKRILPSGRRAQKS
jgi:GTP-binding protein